MDWAGTYEGVLPCADCTGIKTTIVLNNDNTYFKTSGYLDEEENVFDEKGTFEWNNTGSVITLIHDSGSHQYQVGENKLILLDINGNKIAGDLAENYILRKNKELHTFLYKFGIKRNLLLLTSSNRN
ncbi:MAG TPA: copper resistance protein NlpE [Draconibacterium sp.]|nr:copper resistance protein NlpE [Draconibacterium sp.]